MIWLNGFVYNVTFRIGKFALIFNFFGIENYNLIDGTYFEGSKLKKKTPCNFLNNRIICPPSLNNIQWVCVSYRVIQFMAKKILKKFKKYNCIYNLND